MYSYCCLCPIPIYVSFHTIPASQYFHLSFLLFHAFKLHTLFSIYLFPPPHYDNPVLPSIFALPDLAMCYQQSLIYTSYDSLSILILNHSLSVTHFPVSNFLTIILFSPFPHPSPFQVIILLGDIPDLSRPVHPPPPHLAFPIHWYMGVSYIFNTPPTPTYQPQPMMRICMI